eukprot:TRINITY_DN24257_c0_g1_i1.p2 TRINITY_DN24257_c0_g1~~TRINITY_DN24257_c0_g1_i1.p2  ORF type:complete len:162 (+),score=40.90 TRINITY_DN24257_c0_g1_i1:3-488(+)
MYCSQMSLHYNQQHYFYSFVFGLHKSSIFFFFFQMIRQPPRSTHCISSAASDVYKRQTQSTWAAIIIASKKGQFLNLNSGCWIDILEWTAFGFILPFFISEGFDLNRVSFIVTNTDSTDNEPDEELTKQMNEYENFIMQQQQNKISYDNIDESQLELQNYQ